MKTSFKYGIAAGVLSGIIFYAEFFSGVSGKSSGIYSLGATALLLIISIFLYLRKTASPEMNGFYTFRYGFKEGLTVAAVAATVIAVFTFIFFKFINPGYMDALVEAGITQMKQQGANETEILKAASSFRNMHSPVIETAKALIRTLLMGAVFSTIIALVVKRSD